MQYRQLGRSGLKISPICLGTMMFGGPTDEATSSRIVAKAREAGINFIDTADAYNGGKSEQVVGRAISNSRHAGCSRPNSPTRSATIPIAAGCRGAGCCRPRRKA
jgi:aryl-alcohol dehydrogenase-like predicted oxidoreductase